MLMDYYPITIKDSTNTDAMTLTCYAIVNSTEKKEGFDKKVTIYGRKIISYAVIGIITTIAIAFIEESELGKLKKMWKANSIINIIADNGKLYKGQITDEQLNFTENLNNIENNYYYSGTITVEV